ncbi:MAG: hypothetical protein HY689_06815 [Chloroflexi bacterium]|nr:hypothetical protein [Chloroflexota bacterium]
MDPAARPASHLVQRQFTITRLDRVWVGAITYRGPAEGGNSLAVRLDACSRRVVGWALADHLRADLARASPP